MAMGKRERDRQPAMWVTTTYLPTAASHPFYRRLNQLLREHGFDEFAEGQSVSFYAETMGRPGLPPGIYFRLLLIGYFEGIDSERGIAWRAADSLALRDFLGVALDKAPGRRCGILGMPRLRGVSVGTRPDYGQEPIRFEPDIPTRDSPPLQDRSVLEIGHRPNT